MAEGTIARLNEDRGFGFIRPDEGRADLFFHASAVQGTSFEALRTGQQVTFTAEPDPRDPTRQRAAEVRPAEAVAGD
jgi:CspA family cold shock protein